MKYSKQIVKNICNLLSTDEYTQKEVCGKVGIDEDTFKRWKDKYEDFADAIEKARQKLIDKRLIECSKSLTKLINGFEIEEERTEYVRGGDGKPVIRSQATFKKQIAPNLGAIIHYQSNRDPENWMNKQRFEHTGKNGEELKLTPLTKEELEILATLNEDD